MTTSEVFVSCSFYKNEEVEIPIHKWLRIEGSDFVQEIIILNSCQGGINASICRGIVVPVYSSVQFKSIHVYCRAESTARQPITATAQHRNINNKGQ
jgi:hypothetical protein